MKYHKQHLHSLQLAGRVVVVRIALHVQLPQLHEVSFTHIHLAPFRHVSNPHFDLEGIQISTLTEIKRTDETIFAVFLGGHCPGVSHDLESLHGGPGVEGEGEGLGVDAILGG